MRGRSGRSAVTWYSYRMLKRCCGTFHTFKQIRKNMQTPGHYTRINCAFFFLNVYSYSQFYFEDFPQHFFSHTEDIKLLFVWFSPPHVIWFCVINFLLKYNVWEQSEEKREHAHCVEVIYPLVDWEDIIELLIELLDHMWNITWCGNVLTIFVKSSFSSSYY